MPTQYNTLRERYKAFDTRRSDKLDRAREFAKLSIPGVLPDDGEGGDDELPVPYSSLPAEGVMALSAQMVNVLYPLNNVPFFELQVSDALTPEGEDVTEENKVLDRITRRVMDQLAPTNYRSSLFMAMQHLQIVGDVLLYQKPNYDFQIFRLDQYVVRRTPDGEWKELIIEEWVDPEYLPDELQAFPIPDNKQTNMTLGGGEGTVGPAELSLEAVYTQIKWNPQTRVYDVRREFRDQAFDTGTTYEVPPYFPLRWTGVTGEDYGRSLIEDAFGDVRALDVLSKALLDGNILNATFFWGVNPSGITEQRDFDEAQNGASVPAVQGDVFGIQAENQAQVAITLQSVTILEQRLGRRFLMNIVVQPEGERVTARQVSIIARELERNLGGTLSMMSRDIQIPVVRRTMYQMATDELVPVDLAEFISDPQSILKPTIKAGLEVLRREIENEKLSQIAVGIGQLPAEAQAFFNWPAWLNKWIASFGVETVGLIKTQEQFMQEQQALLDQQRALQAEQMSQAVLAKAAEQQPVGA